MADKGGLQLLPETRKKIEVKVPGENRLIYIGAILVGIMLVLYGGLYFYNNSLSADIANADNQLLALEKQRDKGAETKLLTLQKQIGITNQLIKDHVYWTTGFSHLEAAIEPNVQFESFSGTRVDNSLNIRATADNYSTIARQIAALVADDSIKDFTLNNVSTLTSGKLDFSAKINFDPIKFLGTASQSQ